jgi:hypothetical protein
MKQTERLSVRSPSRSAAPELCSHRAWRARGDLAVTPFRMTITRRRFSSLSSK